MSEYALSDDQALELLRLLGWYCLAYVTDDPVLKASELRVKEVAGDLIDSLPNARIRANIGPTALEAMKPDCFASEFRR